MKDLNNLSLINNTIYSKGYTSESYSFINFFLKKHKNIKSFLDIGCGDGILLKLISKKIDYLGVDADVGIKRKKKHNKIKYFKSSNKTELYLKNLKKKYDCVVLMNVLEHTDTFLKLFFIALKKSKKYVLVALPNEDNFLSRIRFLQGKGILTHGLDMIDKKPGHKHQWFIQFNAASQLLKKNAKNYKFNLLNTMYFIQHPKNYLKRIVYKFLMFFVSRQTQMQCFCLVFKKDD
tara:strand:- start:389 stop:1090 length:702 start_codon:yes stop_codon:yes gene_type:complete